MNSKQSIEARRKLLEVISKYHKSCDWDSVLIAVDEYAEQFKAQEQKPVWVKASERNPIIAEDYFVKTIHGRKILYFNGKEWPSYLDDKTISTIEWLDEQSIQKPISSP